MSQIAQVGTYLPRWGDDRKRSAGVDEDAVTLGVAAARAALDGVAPAAVRRVVLVTRELPLLEGGNGAVLLAGIGLPDDVPVVEQVGGAPAALDAVAGAAPGTLVVAADAPDGGPAGAGAVLVGGSDTETGPDSGSDTATGPELAVLGRVTRSLPVRSRGGDGVVWDYDDPRLLRERGVGAALAALELPEKPLVVAGVPAKQVAAWCAGRPPVLPVTGAASAVFALAALAAGGPIVAAEQASAVAVRLDGAARVCRDERTPQPPPRSTYNPGPDLPISLPAYGRAFEPKLRWEAGRCDACGTLALPPRRRCLDCGSEAGWSLTPLPRTGEVYSGVTVHVPVPGLPTPYSLVIVQLDGVDVRALVKVTGVPAGTTGIGDRGTLVLRRVAVRSGVPDYAYALLPEATTGGTTDGAEA